MAKCKNCDFPYATDNKCPNCGSTKPKGGSSYIGIIIIAVIIYYLYNK